MLQSSYNICPADTIFFGVDLLAHTVQLLPKSHHCTAPLRRRLDCPYNVCLTRTGFLVLVPLPQSALHRQCFFSVNLLAHTVQLLPKSLHHTAPLGEDLVRQSLYNRRSSRSIIRTHTTYNICPTQTNSLIRLLPHTYQSDGKLLWNMDLVPDTVPV